ncbi:hypothetical protein IF1G_11350 [Cordyceps javanica]|nr:hypothetical protein IF1G_11350 [Cordyceps javanica]
MAADYELLVAANWYLYCIGCDLLTKIERSNKNRRLTILSELFLRSAHRPLLRITYCRRCALPFAAAISSAAWTDILINRTMIEESKLWERLVSENNGSTPESANGSCFLIENPRCILLSTEFTYCITDYGRDYMTLNSRYPALSRRDFGRFEALDAIDQSFYQNAL